MEILTNTIPINIHFKLRQAEEVVRIEARREKNTFRKDFNSVSLNRDAVLNL